jgi:endonuclease YncB( thermonuclease family)
LWAITVGAQWVSFALLASPKVWAQDGGAFAHVTKNAQKVRESVTVRQRSSIEESLIEMHTMRPTIFLLLLLLAAAPAPAITLTGRVIGVHDGDTITVLDGDQRPEKIRLAGIDAPELGQPHGKRSKLALSEVVYRMEVRIDWDKRDRYGRIVGKVWVIHPTTGSPQTLCSPKCPYVDVNLGQIQAGMAWWYRQYQGEQSPEDRKAYEVAETGARSKKVGLWVDPEPTPPWDWRHSRKPRAARP